MKRAFLQTWKVLVLVAILTLAALPFVTPPAEGIPACGKCVDGTFSTSTMMCGGTAADCSECTVCAK